MQNERGSERGREEWHARSAFSGVQEQSLVSNRGVSGQGLLHGAVTLPPLISVTTVLSSQVTFSHSQSTSQNPFTPTI